MKRLRLYRLAINSRHLANYPSASTKSTSDHADGEVVAEILPAFPRAPGDRRRSLHPPLVLVLLLSHALSGSGAHKLYRTRA